MEAAIKTLENQLKQKKENLKKLQDEISALESVIQNLKPKTQTQNTETIILPESPPKSPVTKKPHKFYVIFNEPMKWIYDEWHKAAPFKTNKNVIHQSFPTIDDAKRALEESSKKNKSIETSFKDRLLLGGGGSMQPTVKMTPIGKIPTIATIIGTKEVQNQIKPTLEKFLENFDEINTYPENTKYKHIYPKNHQGLGPKAIVLPEASPITTINLHSFGLIETLYIQNP